MKGIAVFSQGKRVSWFSYPGGVLREKEGLIVGVVPAFVQPSKSAYPKLWRRTTPGKARNHESYIVECEGEQYWPVVSSMSLLTPKKTTKTKTTEKPKSVVDMVTESMVAPKREIINHIAFCLDHSGSMGGLTNGAMRDFNNQIDSIRKANSENNQETFITVNRFGVSRGTEFSFINVPIDEVQRLYQYGAYGSTPMYDSIGQVINTFKEIERNSSGKDVSFLIEVITDGEENASYVWNRTTLRQEITRLQESGRWTFVFRVPNGYGRRIVDLNVPQQNIFEWDGRTERSLDISSKATQQGVNSFYQMRASGQTQSTSFYANLTADDKTIKTTLHDITNQVHLWPVTEEIQIRDFTLQHISSYTKGNAFYQLTKPEDVQHYKQVIIQDKRDGKIYGGDEAKNLLGIPLTAGTIRLRPGNCGNYDVFVESTSVNRKLLPNTRLLYLK